MTDPESNPAGQSEPPSLLQPLNDEACMRAALQEALAAYEKGEVPVGAVVVRDGKIIGRGHNLRETLNDPTAHAEMLAMTSASESKDSWRLEDCTLYVTLEPCPMCAGALVLGRLDRLVYGTPDPKTGAVESLYNIVQDERLNHRLEVTGGVLQADCQKQLQDFFKRRREENGKIS